MTTSAEFQALFQQGKRVDQPSMFVLWRSTETTRRAGFAVSRQVGGAVERNRVKRRLREVYRAARAEAPARVSLVIVGRRRAVQTRFADLVTELRRALEVIAGASPSP